MRRLLLLVSAIVFVDTAFYAAIIPLLPDYVSELGLTKSQAGVLSGSYAAGTLLGSLPCAWLAARAGARRTVLAGLGLVAGASLVFGVAREPWLLDAARFVQGFGGAASWAGSLTWLVGVAPADRRGELIGTALGAAVAGALFGPVIGSAATVLGTAAVFSSVCVFSLVLAAWSMRMPAPPPPAEPAPLRGVARAIGTGPVVLGCWLMALPSLFSGAFNTLVPLRLDDLGAGALVIGGSFVVAAAIEAVIAPVIGRLSDRRGRFVPLRWGIAGLVLVGVLLPLPDQVAGLVVLVLAIAIAAGACFAPAMALLSDAADHVGLPQAYAFGLMNLTWAAGQTIGAGGGGALADATADGTVFLVGAGVAAATLAALQGRRAPAPAQ